MKPFVPFESKVVRMELNNIDTDQIIPARFLKTTSKEGLDQQLFNDWRYLTGWKSQPGIHSESAGGAGKTNLTRRG